MRRPVAPAMAAVAAFGCALLAGCGGSDPPVTGFPGAELTDLPSRQPLPSWTAQQPTSFVVVAGGDVLIHPEITEQAVADGGGTRDYRPVFAGVKQVVSAADLALCHLEVPLDQDGPFAGWPEFNAPAEVASALAEIGYDGCSTASNHTLDQGQEGVRSTLDVLDTAGIKHTGSARGPDEARTPMIYEVNGAKVGHVSFSFGFNGLREPRGAPWLANELEVDQVLAAARAAKQAGADVVIASLHWGTEFQAEPTEQQQSMARTLLADDAIDLIIGHHAGVVQPFEQIGGEWVAYGLGNHLARYAEPRGTTEEGVLARFRFAKDGTGQWRVDHADYVPTLIDHGPPIRLVDLTAVGNSERRTQALHRIDQVVHSRGAQISRSGG